MLISVNDLIIESKINPILLKVNNEIYMIIVDYFQKIDHIIIDDVKYFPYIIPDWVPFSIFKFNGNLKNYKIYDKFSIVPGKEFKISFYRNIIIRKNYMMTYHKIIPKCMNSPRFYNYSFDFDLDYEDDLLKNSILMSKDKLFGIYYYHENDRKIIHYFPISIILNLINGSNDKVISLSFTNNDIKKIGKSKIRDGKMYNYNLKINLPIDTNLMIEGNLDDHEIVEYNNKIKMKNEYYQISEYNGFIFIKGDDDNNISKNNKKLIKNFY